MQPGTEVYVVTKLVSPGGKELLIGEGQPTIIIGERINPFGKSGMKEAMIAGDMERVRQEAVNQVQAGADALVVSVGAFGIDEPSVFPRVVAAVKEAVDLPLVLESKNPDALRAALALGVGTPIISSVTGEDAVLEALLPIVREHNTAVIALATDSAGVPATAEKRMDVIRRIMEKAGAAGIAPESVLVDCLAESIAVSGQATHTTLTTMRMVSEEFGLNLVLGASNVSFGLPGRPIINAAFMALAIAGGLTAAITNPTSMKAPIMATDLLLGRDARARRYVTYFRTLKKA